MAEVRTKELDGLRGIAVIMVMALHIFKRANEFTQHPALYFITSLTSIGWVGVDIFFVLSGFLITSILLRTKEKENYFKNFYMRRILRIFPLYYICIGIIIAFIPILDPGFSSQIPRVLPLLILYQQNWISIFGGVWLTQYLTVTWSLAIEEQFYLIWPAIVYFAQKNLLIKISIGVIILSVLVRILGLLFWNNTNQITVFFFYNTFTRFEQLVFGALLAIAFTFADWKERLRVMSFPVFLVSFSTFIALCIVALPNIPHPAYGNIPLTLAGYTLSSIFSAALIAFLLLNYKKTILHKFFQTNVLVFFGIHSYAMYLLHLPIALILLDALWHTEMRGWKAYFAYIILSYSITAVISFLTWHLLEKHMLNLKRYFEYS